MARTAGLLAFGGVNSALAGYFHDRGIEGIPWSFSDHPGGLAEVRSNGGTFRVHGEVLNKEFPVQEAASLEELVKSQKFLILATRVDTHERYVAELEKLNDMLGDTVLLVINGIGFTMLYSHRLNVKYILETNLSPTASGLDDDKSAVNFKAMKGELELSCFPLCYKNPANPDPEEADLPDEIKSLLREYFDIKIVPRVPFYIAIACVNAMLHLPPVVLNAGRLPDEGEELTELAREYISRLQKIDPGNLYGHWMNTYVNRIQTALDQERVSLGAECGHPQIRTLLDNGNKLYDTLFGILREYCAMPVPFNVQSLVPLDLDSRLYREEYPALALLRGVDRIAAVPTHFNAWSTEFTRSMELTVSFMIILKYLAPEGKPFETYGRDLKGFTREDLVLFGANFGSLPISGGIESFDHIAALGERDAPIVTMYSGGLDSTYLLFKLQQLGFKHVHAVAVNVGAPIDEDKLTKSAAHFGATFHCIDGRKEFVEEGVGPAIRANAMYMEMYPVSSSLSRPVIARLVVDFARIVDAEVLLHTANLSQNSLPRLNNSIRRCGFARQFGSPYVRSVVSRKKKAEELSAAGLQFMSERHLSGDENVWCREFESGPLDDPEDFFIPEDAYEWTRCDKNHQPEKLTLGFESGNPVSVNGEKRPLIEIITLLNKEVGKFGHGRFVGLEHISTDDKVLEVREAPAAAIIMNARRQLEAATLTTSTLTLKRSLEDKWTMEVVSGHWGSSSHKECERSIAAMIDSVSGTVTYKLSHQGYFPCSIKAGKPRYIRDRDAWEYQAALKRASLSPSAKLCGGE
jgi:argininosuccinate synthase